ncbi:MAG: Rab family GTPase [Candidatus Kariarchaeaceae archaeon]
MPTPKYTLKITLLGDGEVGKTSLRQRFMGARFPKEYLITIGADFSITEKIIDDARILYQVWDLAGQPSFKKVRELYYRGCYGALIVFDVTKKESLNSVEEWADELWTNNGRENVPIVLLGNKSDLESAIPEEKILEKVEALSVITREYGYEVPYMSTSALKGDNVDEAFMQIGRLILNSLSK